MIKLSLNALKARTLAKQVGLIPEPQSQWKWALRQLRQPNPTGQPTTQLLKSPRELAKTKEKVIGLLPNNDRQKIKALQRKQPLGVEVALTHSNKTIVGEKGAIPTFSTLKAHTHPSFDKTLYRKNNTSESKRLLSPVLDSAPSGVNFNFNQAEASRTRLFFPKLQSLKSEISHTQRNIEPHIDFLNQKRWSQLLASRNTRDIFSDFKKIDPSVKTVSQALNKNYGAINFKDSTTPIKLMSQQAKLRGSVEKLQRTGKETKNLRQELRANTGLSFRKATDLVTKKRIQNQKINNFLSENRWRWGSGPGGDLRRWGVYSDFASEGIKHNIVSPKTTGVHTFRDYKLPQHLRSVYFKGGLD